jgi:signal transduction histidine kinase
LQPDHIVWFPGRLRHIVSKEGYEFRFTDNGTGMPADQAASMLELFYRAAPTRAAGLGVGLAVVKFMVEQCCGTIAVTSGEGQGTANTFERPPNRTATCERTPSAA